MHRHRAAPISLRAVAVLGPPLGLGALLAASASCTRRGPPVIAPVEVIAPASPDAAVVAPLRAAAASGPRCSSSISAGSIRTSSACVLDEQVSKGRGTLRYPCTGDGPADATMGKHHYEGAVTAGRIDLVLKTELDWDDGCHWETRQTLAGTLRSKVLRWNYQEHPVAGTSCFGSCVASAEVVITPQGAPAGPGPEADDDEADDEGAP